ncbi:MAG: indolepyruvate ferredoxin oxidoreductase family protein, partial [Alphaproteobacteria bacterium]|nr:indolepyruvate ferredoxin oxidoreductase family protein [Alphaproteobacteria bacterium]
LYNDATAATGGQPLPGLMTVPALTRQLEAEGVKSILVVTDEPDKYGAAARFAPNAEIRHRDELDFIQKRLRETPGVTAIVYDQTCAAEKRRRRKRGKFPDPARRAFINARVCEGCGDCNLKSNCVSVLPLETDFGRKRMIDQSTCNKDFSCQRGFCPSYVTVEGGMPRRGREVAAATELFARLPTPAQPALDHPHGIVVSGIGGTGVITIGALLGMAAHLEGKGVTVLDMTGVAQKGGAVTTFVRIGATPEALHTIRIAAGDADAVIGGDILVTCENAVLTRLRKGRSKAVVNTNRLPPVSFIRNPDLKTPWTAMEEGIAQAIGPEAVAFIDASRYATTLLGDSLMTNLFLLGFAYQSGLVPVSEGSILRAIEINGASVDKNKLAFQWGRLAAHDRAAVDRALRGDDAMEAGEGAMVSLAETVARRRAELVAYQNEAYAARYADFVERVRAEEAKRLGGDRLAKAVARNLFKLMAYKDEYEVARLMTDGAFEREIAAAFEGDYTIRYHMAPPLLARFDAKIGEPRKIALGAWLRPVLALAASFKGLRGTLFDVFGYTAERRMERGLITAYEATIVELLAGLAREKLDLAVEIAELPDSIRGFGHVKQRHVAAAGQKQMELMRQYRTPTAPQRAAA